MAKRSHPAALTRVFRSPRFKKTYGGLAEEESLTRPPKGIDIDTPHIDAIKMKHFFGIVEIDVKKTLPKNLRSEVAQLFRDVYPLVQYLREASKSTAR